LCTHPQQHRLGLSSGLSFCCLAFPTLSDSFVSDFLGAFQVSAFAIPFPAVPTLPDHFRALLLESRSLLGFEFSGRWRAFPFRADQTLSGLPGV
ncbi:hypothetical protein, partial [Streptomyces sp. NRRL S-98]|uniref:hypothetical protein n=2 Tax=unclassified Streptomyces TaxID=2593676 RepID=UPI001C1E5A2A